MKDSRSISSRYFVADAQSGAAASRTAAPSMCSASASKHLLRRSTSSALNVAMAAQSGAARSVMIANPNEALPQTVEHVVSKAGDVAGLRQGLVSHLVCV